MYRNNQKVEGEITGITEYGVFVKLEDNYFGLIHISEVSNDFVSDLKSLFKVGDKIKAQILSIDDENKQIKLTIKDKKKRRFLEEKGQGFAPLKENLGYWIEEKLKELKKN